MDDGHLSGLRFISYENPFRIFDVSSTILPVHSQPVPFLKSKVSACKVKQGLYTLKLNYRKKVFYFALNFLPWEFLLMKKLDFEKTKAT